MQNILMIVYSKILLLEHCLLIGIPIYNYIKIKTMDSKVSVDNLNN